MSESDVRDSRNAERFLIEPPMEALFGGAAIDIVDIAARGLRSEHSAPVRPGTSGLLSFRLPGQSQVVRVRAEVVWSRLSKKASPEGKLLYLTGLRLQEETEAMAVVIEDLVRAEKATRDRESLEKKRAKQVPGAARPRSGSDTVKVIRQHRRIDEDTLLLVKQAWNYMKLNPVEANKWYNRAKFSMKEKNAPRLFHKDDVLAIWEYLERMVPVETIDWVLDNEHLY